MEPAEYATLRALEDRFWWYRALHRLVAEWSRSDGGSRRLDAGCGTGGMLARWAQQDGNGSSSEAGGRFGLDWSPLALAGARAREAAFLARGSVESLPYSEKSFGLVISLDVLYHRAVRDDAAALREFRRVLRPGGRLLLNLPAFESLRSSHDAAIHTARRYRRGELRRLLESAGLEPERVTYRNALLFPALAAVRWLRRGDSGSEHAPAPSDVRPLPGPIDALLFRLLDLERPWLRRFDLPFGLSVFAVARRPLDS